MSTDEVCAALVGTLSPDATPRRQAEQFLKRLESQPGFPVVLLQLVQTHSASDATAQSPLIRSAAAVYFKNIVKRGWDEGDGENEVTIARADREAIKGAMVKLVCECGHANVQSQLSAALTLISKSDFPAKWPNLLPDLVSQMSSNEFKTISGMLLTANSILKRFRYAFKSDALYSELKYVLDMLAEPLTLLFKRLGAALAAAGGDSALATTLLEALRLGARIWFSLNWQDLPEFFEDHMAEWMAEFEKYLAYENAALAGDDDDDTVEEGPVERLQAAIVENVTLYASKYEEEFGPYLPGFAAAVWGRLMKTSASARHDQLAATSIRFLAGVVGKQMHTGLFSDEATLRQIIEAIVIPNMSLRDSDVELFEDNPVEYISRDLESADSETRRRGARDLVHAMCKHHDATTTRICGEHISQMLARYAADPAGQWRAKDAALHLVVALTVRAESQRCGVSQTSAGIDVLEIYNAHVAPELASVGNGAARAVIQADCIQFACTFRNQLPAETLSQLVPTLAQHVQSPNRVVHTYAAACLERCLSIPGKVRRETLASQLASLFEALFGVLERSAIAGSTSNEEWENEYVMKCVMRLLIVSQQDVAGVAGVLIVKLTACLGKVCANPRNPRFNHYLFESLAVLVRAACGRDAAARAGFEQLLFPPFQSVLQMEVMEFAPYVFQILALLLSYHEKGTKLSAAYVSLLPPLLHPALWERRGNVPALASLLNAYLVAGAAEVVAGGQLEPMLGVFQKLLATKHTETHAFALLNSLVAQCAPEHYVETYLPTIVQLLLTRLQMNRERANFVHNLLAFCGLLAGKHGGQLLAAQLERQQPGMTASLAQHVFLPTLSQTPFADAFAAKSAAVGMTRLLCEAPDHLCQPDTQPWQGLLTLVQSMLAVVQQPGALSVAADAAVDDDVPEELLAGYDSTFSKLHFGSAKKQDNFSEICDVHSFFRDSLKALCAAKPHFIPLCAAVR